MLWTLMRWVIEIDILLCNQIRQANKLRNQWGLRTGPGKTKTTRTFSFWDTPTAPWLPILVIHIRSLLKPIDSQSYKFKKNAKNSIFLILLKTLLETHLLKLIDIMHKYEMDPTRTVGATERARGVGRAGGRTDGVKPIYHPTTPLGAGIINSVTSYVYQLPNHLCKTEQMKHSKDVVIITRYQYIFH